MTHALSLTIEIRKAGWIYEVEMWRRPELGGCVVLTEGDAIGVVVQMLVGGKHARFAAGYAEED